MRIIIALLYYFFILSMVISSFDVEMKTVYTAALIIIGILIAGPIIYAFVVGYTENKEINEMMEETVAELKEDYPN